MYEEIDEGLESGVQFIQGQRAEDQVLYEVKRGRL
jgi:hypothetical protein